MSLCEHISRVVRRSRAFYQATTPGHLLVIVNLPAACPPIPPLYEFDLSRELRRWLDCRLAATRPLWAAKEGLDDDGLPQICPHFGIAEHSAWLGMDVQLQQSTCLPSPIVHCAEDIGRLKLDPAAPWFRYMKEGYDYLRSKKDGTFVLSVRGAMAPMELANAVRGDAFFEDVIVDKPFVHQLIAWLTDAFPWYYNQLVSWADPIDTGHAFTYPGGWLDGRALSHLSNDAAMLCGPDIYREFGFPYESRLVSGYDGCVYHVHNQHMHFIPDLARLPGLMLIEVTHDPKTPNPIEDLPRIFAHTGNANLMLRVTSDQTRAHIDDLKSRNVLLDVVCRDRADATDIIALVRSRSEPL